MSMSKLALSVSTHELRPAGRVGGVDHAEAGCPRHVHHEVAREAHDERLLRARLDVRHHQRVGTLSFEVGIGVRVAERGRVAGVVHEGAGVGADDQVVGAAGRCRRELRDDDALDVADAGR